MGILECLHVHQEHQSVLNSIFRTSSLLVFWPKLLSAFKTSENIKAGKWSYCNWNGPTQWRWNWKAKAWDHLQVLVLGRFDSSSQSLSDTIINLLHLLQVYLQIRCPVDSKYSTCVGDMTGVAVTVHFVPFCMDHQIRAVLKMDSY